ncbi:hypothetical protein M758_3G025900 [Ceratodon purpureus]|uniref:Uncharacterized protein n=1 Tax=Ceratodon purpureus TaxID=3225 RepID=A0A8T0IGH5_CERPU|nr:hypothetical protein KC19_3G026500 [Ceratodon purpureus]KAG0621520.1 hypothetical protein M758_3G025900 [Ceratodon purpureus]
MGKSIRSKRLKRLRTLKRELVTPHYDEKEALKNSAMEAALAAPKVELPKKRVRDEAMEVEEPTRGRPGQSSTAMVVDEAGTSTSGNDSKLKARGGIKKRGKSQGRLKKERHHKKKLQF